MLPYRLHCKYPADTVPHFMIICTARCDDMRASKAKCGTLHRLFSLPKLSTDYNSERRNVFSLEMWFGTVCDTKPVTVSSRRCTTQPLGTLSNSGLHIAVKSVIALLKCCYLMPVKSQAAWAALRSV